MVGSVGVPRRDRQRERRQRRVRGALLAPRIPQDLEEIPYRRTCHRCGRQVEGIVGTFGAPIPGKLVPAVDLLVREHGHYVCTECDPEANMGWLLDIQSHLAGRPFDDD